MSYVCFDMVFDTKYLATLNTAQRFNCGAYRRVRISTIDKAVFVKFGDATVDASAADDNTLIPADNYMDFETGPTQTHVSLLEQAASAKATIALIG